MRSTTDIVFDVTGQTLAYRVPQGRPTSATFDVFPDFANDDATAEFSGTATVDSVNTTIDLACGSTSTDVQRINLTATTSIAIGKKYLISEGSRQEWVEPIQIVSADYIRVRHPLQNAYTTSATFVGTNITAAVDATWVADTANISDHSDPNPTYRVRWEIVVGSSTYVAYSYFDLVRAPVTYQVDIDDLNSRAPGLMDSIPLEYATEQGRPLLDSAWRSVQAKFSTLGIDTDAIRDDQILDEAVILRSLYMLAQGGWKPLGYDLAAYVADTRAEYDRFIEQHFQATLKHKLSTGSSGGADVVGTVPFWSK